MYTLGAAARACGRSKATISRAIKSGRISAARNEDGGYVIDPAELHRVYPATGDTTVAVKQSDTPNGSDATPSPETVALQRLLDEKDARIADQAEVITDLRKRLDLLTALLTHRQAGSVPAAGSPSFTAPRSPWWRRWFRG